MPYAYDPLLKDPKDDPNNPDNAGPQVAGSGQVMGGGTDPQSQSTTATKQPGGSGFTNLNSYLDANAGSQFGSQFADKVSNDVNAAGAAQVQGQQAFKDTVDKSVVKQDKSTVDSAIADPEGYLYGSAGTDNFNNQTADLGKLKGFQDQYNASYQGPNQYSDSQDAYQKAAGATQKASDVSQAAQSEPGRFALLDNYFGQSSGRQGDYNQGQKGLDNLLVQGDKTAQASLAQARSNAQTSSANFEGQKKTLSDYAATGRGQTEATQNYARGALGTDKAGNLGTTGAVPDYLKGLDASVTQRQADAGTDYRALQAALLDENPLGRLTPEQRQSVGVENYAGVNYSPVDFHTSYQPFGDAYSKSQTLGKNSLFNLSPAQVSGFAHQISDSDINRGSVQTAEGARKLKALEQLGGLNAQVTNPQDAGKYTSGNLAQFDSPQFNAALKTEQSNAQGGLDSIRTRYQGDSDAFNQDPLNERYKPLYDSQNYVPRDHGEADFSAGMPLRQSMIKQDMAAKYAAEVKALRDKYKI